jgi:CHAD domain-containing protein
VKLAQPQAGAFVVRALSALDVELAAAAPRVFEASDAEAIHDLRVALRRLRTLLRLARGVLGRFHADAVRAALGDIQRATGALRDAEVVDELFADLAIETEPFTLWRARRRATERARRRDVLAKLAAGDLDRARALLGALLTLPVNPSRDVDAAKLARRAVRSAEHGVVSHGTVDVSDVTALHELRIAYKRLRYAAEMLKDALPPELFALRERAVLMQKRLGEIHDVDVALDLVRRARSLAPTLQARVLAALRQERLRRVDKYLRALTPPAASHSEISPPSGEPRPDSAGRPVRAERSRSSSRDLSPRR